jgi:hypothetical protein
MPSYNIAINQIDTDNQFFVWGCGQDLRRFNGASWEYYNYTNSVVPSSAPYYLDTRSISIDPEEKVWCGVAQGPIAGLNEVAVFYVNSNDVYEGQSWNFSDLGTFTEPQEISHIYACPFGDDILAFSTPLNGIGGTGASGYVSSEISGVTGGRLFYHLKETDQWKETAPGYIWPHVYDIIAKGYDGKDYFYYIGTSEGLFIIPQNVLEYTTLIGGEKYLEQATVYNTKTSGIISDYIYSLDLDENGNLWIGTDMGLSFFDGYQFWNYPVSTGPITKVVSRPNGHVFYTSGDGENAQGTGIWHFNGTSHTQYSSSNSSLPDDDVLDIKLVTRNITQSGLTVYENSLWVLSVNEISSFNYDIPHVYGSSKYEGATGWNFTYFTATGGTSAPLPKVDKYTWLYPDWRVYQDDYLALKFPGLDPRNLFLTTELKAVADGRAGKQSYWDNWPIASYEESLLVESITGPDWNSAIQVVQQSSAGVTGYVNITSSTSISTKDGIKYYVGGYITGDIVAIFGYYNDSGLATLSQINPTIGGSTDPGIDDYSSLDNGKMGFIVSYNEKGNVDSILPFRGYKTEIQDLAPSPDEDFIVATGIFDRFIESGPYVWDSKEGEVVLRGGPTGAPSGVTTRNVSGLTSGTYPWIYQTSLILSDDWVYLIGDYGQSIGDFDIGFQGLSKWENIGSIYVNYEGAGGNFETVMNEITTANSIVLSYIPTTSYATYRIDSIVTLPNNATGLLFNVTYSDFQQAGATAGTFTQTSGATFNIEFNDSSIYSYPLVTDLSTRSTVWNNNNYTSNSIFVAKVGSDLGNTFTFTDLAATGDYNRNIRSSYRGVSFRNFPGKYFLNSNLGDIKESKLDVTKYSVNLGLKSTPYFTSGSSTADLSTLKNAWNRTNDYTSAPSLILGSTAEISQNWAYDSILSYVRLSINDLELISASTSQSTYPGVGPTSADRTIKSVRSIEDNNSTIITGISNKNFNFGGIGITGTTNVYTPFYEILSPDGYGVTGGFLNGTTGSGSYPVAAKDESAYYVTSIFGTAGTYFGNNFSSGLTSGTNFLTAKITDQGTTLESFNNYIGLDPSGISLENSWALPNDNYLINYRETIGATSYSVGLLKTNRLNKNLDLQKISIEEDNSVDQNISLTSTVDDSGNIFMSGFNYGVTGSGFISTNQNSGFSFIAKQYVPELGINLGNIISRPGSGAWTWCDVHSTDKGMQIPLLSTVIFNNYASDIYGKQNNKWILSNSQTGEEILNVKSTPYFIFTFSEAGNYTIYNQVEDSFGNVYATTKPGFIEVVNHKVKKPEDRNPDYVDSFDYGQPEPFAGRDSQALKLSKDLAEAQRKIMEGNNPPIGTGLVIPNNPDATFRED